MNKSSNSNDDNSSSNNDDGNSNDDDDNNKQQKPTGKSIYIDNKGQIDIKYSRKRGFCQNVKIEFFFLPTLPFCRS